MANSPQAIKRARQNDDHRAHNASRRSMLRTAVKRVLAAIRAGDADTAGSRYQAAVPLLDRMAARGLCNYGAEEARQIMGLPSSRFAEVLGYVDEAELIHRDNLVLT